MKKRLLVLACVLGALLFSACAHTQGGQEAAHSPAIDRIVERGELIVGTAASMPPLNMTTKTGEVIGLEVDLARYMANGMGVELRLETMPFGELLSALELGQIDMIVSGMTITPGRNLKVAFVGTYFISGKSILTKLETLASAKEAAEINRPDVKLAALEGSTSQYFVEKVIPKATLVTTKAYDEAVRMVLEDEVHALVADYPICMVSSFRYPEAGLVALAKPLTYEPLGIALPPNDPLLVNWVENFLARVEGSGELQRLKRRWFEDASWVKRLP